ncbi:MAG: DUF4123 domain-containing protein [Methylococcaceae bacterium]|jgi:hypothetical protein
MQKTAAVLAFLQAQIQPEQPLYAIVDAAQDSKAILQLLKHAVPKLNIANLFEGERGEELAPAAPYLVEFTREGHPLLVKLANQGWQRNWAVYFAYPNGFENALHKLRRDISVTDSDHMPMLFRFYDPNVFQRYLPLFDA